MRRISFLLLALLLLAGCATTPGGFRRIEANDPGAQTAARIAGTVIDDRANTGPLNRVYGAKRRRGKIDQYRVRLRMADGSSWDALAYNEEDRWTVVEIRKR